MPNTTITINLKQTILLHDVNEPKSAFRTCHWNSFFFPTAHNPVGTLVVTGKTSLLNDPLTSTHKHYIMCSRRLVVIHTRIDRRPRPLSSCCIAIWKSVGMYPNPFDRKHSTIRQMIDRIISPDSLKNKKKGGLPAKSAMGLKRYDSSNSNSSSGSSKSFKQTFMMAMRT